MPDRVLYPATQAPILLPEVDWEEASHPEAWMQQPTEPVLVAGHLFANGSTLEDPARLLDAEFPSMDKWWQPASEPVREVPYSFAAIEESGEAPQGDFFFAAPSGTGTAIAFFAHNSLVIFPRVTLYQALAYLEPVTSEAETVTVDKWWMPASQPLFQLGRAVDEGLTLDDVARLLDVEFPSYDKWRAEYPDQHLVPLWPVAEGLFLADYARLLDAEFTFTTWWRQTEEPVREIPFLVANGWWALNEFPLEPITLDKWYVQHPEQHLVPLYPTPEGLFLPDYARLLDAEDPNLKWWMPAEEPVRVAPHLLANGLWEMDARWEAPPIIEDITMDKWWVQPDEPLRVAGHLLSNGSIFLTDPARLLDAEFPHIEGFWRDPEIPVLPLHVVRPGGEDNLIIAPLFIPGTSLGWYVQPEEPLRVLAAVYFREGYFYIHPIPLTPSRGSSRSVMRPGLDLAIPNNRVDRPGRRL